MSHIPNLHGQHLDLDKKDISTTAREKEIVLANSRDIVDYHSTNAQSVLILSRLTPKMTRCVFPYTRNIFCSDELKQLFFTAAQTLASFKVKPVDVPAGWKDLALFRFKLYKMNHFNHDKMSRTPTNTHKNT